jgi:hypothetical protein
MRTKPRENRVFGAGMGNIFSIFGVSMVAQLALKRTKNANRNCGG